MEEKKVKIKELVGKGLGSYHTKVKQQIDRIEKKNKEQNHKISILTNELDNDYLTKTEEGSVISLEHSKEGMVYIDGLEGNTLVNYCSDGSKEMTLNGDIDVEGTFVTTTEGVDGGLIDVVCEGNTLVNHCTDGAKELTLNGDIDTSGTFVTTTEGVEGGLVDVVCEGNTLINLVDSSIKTLTANKTTGWIQDHTYKFNNLVKPNTLYTVVCQVLENTSTTSFGFGGGSSKYSQLKTVNNDGSPATFSPKEVGVKKWVISSFESFENQYLIIMPQFGSTTVEFNSDEYIKYRYLILEGDWTNKEIPAYFEGMKSVGQDDVNGHKVELVSRNKNLCSVNSYIGLWHNIIETNIKCKTNTTYTLSFNDISDESLEGNRGITVITHKTKTDGEDHAAIYLHAIEEGGKEYVFRQSGFTFNTGDCCYISLTSNNMSSIPNLNIQEIQLEEGSSHTTYTPHASNTLSIPLSEPLRGLPNGVKDRFVKKDGKWYVERNCGKIVLNGSQSSVHETTDANTCRFFTPLPNYNVNTNTVVPFINDRFVNVNKYEIDEEGIFSSWGGIYLRLNKTRLNTISLQGYKDYLVQNPTTVIYELKTPTYEPIENVELITYLETTHISNNSLIPCNMVVKNTGYNTIAIKPSTLYTVALDKNGSGTISANLGGTTATTTTNILTVTTPATLTSDLLTLSGKGIKCSNIRLLEGDKTNEIPEYFEGMKSVGELEGNKVEVLSSNNGNLFNKNNIVIGYYINRKTNALMPQPKSFYCDDYIQVASGLKLYFNEITIISLYDKDKNFISGGYEGREPYIIPIGVEYIKISFYNRINLLETVWVGASEQCITSKNFTMNTKQIPLTEPLRGLPNGVKDRFVKIGGKWYIERNCGNHTITSNSNIEKHSSSSESMLLLQVWSITPTPGGGNNIISDSLFGNKNSWTNPYHIYQSGGTILFSVPTTVFPTLTDFKTWLSNNPFNIIYQLATPTYEPIENIELTTYLDTTHISNNSLIPCNMQVKNTGYNAIIKPSTLYTIALDTNKSGTIGCNLGGVKGTTTNNVLTLTTPATLSDDSLRVYGKGIKGSKIRLLEGDKTGWISSHFEGMKSSFEDKLQEDGTYKMEILSNNKNVLNLDDIVMKDIGTGCKLDACSTDLIQYTSNQAEWTQIFFMMKLKPFTRYTLSAELQSMNVYVFNDRVGTWDTNKYIGAMQNTTNTLQKKQHSFTTNKNGCISIRFTNERMLGVNIAKNIILSEVVGEYIPKKSNKIQFSSIEPLRKWDRFVFKDDKLMIERNSEKVVLDETQTLWSYSIDTYKPKGMFAFSVSGIDLPKNSNQKTISEDLPKVALGVLNSNDFKYEGFDVYTEPSWGYSRFYIALNNTRLNIQETDTVTQREEKLKSYLSENNMKFICFKDEPTYEEIPYELQKIILEGYENGTLFIDTNIPPTVTTTYAGQTPIVSTVNESEVAVASVTSDINDIIVPYLCDMDYRIVALQLQNEPVATMNTYKLLGSTYDMIKRDILSKRYSSMEYLNRMSDYHSLGRITDSELDELKQLVTEVLSNE